MHKLSLLTLFFFISIQLYSQSPHGDDFDFDCEDCHTTDDWVIDFKKLSFDHTQTTFELVGQHKVLDCQSCHKTLKFSEAKKNCFDCHNNIHQNTVEPNCQQCHNSNSWVVNNIDEMHDMGRFPLLGAHKLADCQECHASVSNLTFQSIGVKCNDCHIADYQSTQTPNHVEANFSKECEDCHQVSDLQWRNGSINHDFFPLVGGHRIGNCFDCHTQKSFEGLSQDCKTCHLNDFNSTKDPNHLSAEFSTNCIECHTTNPNWQPASFKDHNSFFELVGAHKIIENDCSKCHSTGYSNTPNQCFDCHKSNYNATKSPAHQAAGFGTDCETCHNSNTWKPASFDHDNQFFPIYSGEHKGEWNQCSDCHTSATSFQVFSCITCHEHNKSDTDNKHNGVQGYKYISTDCLGCHPNGTEDGAFNHATSAFPLVGEHTAQECSDCHLNGYTESISTECSDCHLKDFNSSADPNHKEVGITLLCEDCHNSSAWKPSGFNHTTTGFELVGGHNITQCSNCHSVNTSNATSICYDCHANNFNSAPEHTAQNYPHTCEDCHNTTDWKETTFDHNNTSFALTGAHTNTDCASCHSTGYAGTSSACSDCHITDFNNSTNPNHKNLSLSTNCESCHTTNLDWQPATFSVHNDFYVLQGAHVSLINDCASCHNGNYSNTPSNCYGCHQGNYNATSNPKHSTSGFGTACEDCHSQNAWQPATFDHDGSVFPNLFW